MSSSKKQKGDREERAVVEFHRELGIDCERTLTGGARNTGATYDIDLDIGDGLKGECKMRKDGFKQLYTWIDGRDFLTVRADRKERLYVIPEGLWKVFLKNMLQLHKK